MFPKGTDLTTAAKVTRLHSLLVQYDGTEIWTEVNSSFIQWVQIIDTSCMSGSEMRCRMERYSNALWLGQLQV